MYTDEMIGTLLSPWMYCAAWKSSSGTTTTCLENGMEAIQKYQQVFHGGQEWT